MCGLAGYSLGSTSRIDRTLAAQALLAGIAERGADAVGYAWRAPTTAVGVEKRRSRASALLERIQLANDVTEALVHVRDHTKGSPTVEANNHPVRHRSIVGVHNGTIENDDALFERLGVQRHTPEATVDSEVIFALAAATRSNPRALEQLRGSMASAWLDEREPGVLRVARSSGRPLWLGRTRDEVFFASTRYALDLLQSTIGLRLQTNAIDEGVLLVLSDGRVESHQRFRPDRGARDERVPPVRAPHEASRCRRRLAALSAHRHRSGAAVPVLAPDLQGAV